MGQAKRGRPRKAGIRNAKGRLIVVPDRGNDRVVARTLSFARFHRAGADQQLVDQIGRVWTAGLLDGRCCDGAMLRDIGRRYASLYWHQFAALAPKTMQLERRDRAAANDAAWDDKPGEYFGRLEEAARAAGRDAVTAMHALCVDGWWFPDTDAPWIDRLIRSAMYDAGGPAEETVATNADRLKLDAAMRALEAMVGGKAMPFQGAVMERS